MHTTPRRPAARRDNDATLVLQHVHARDIDRALRDLPDTASLRAQRQGGDVRLFARQHGDTLVRRIFSRPAIDDERRGLRDCLAQVLGNLTPDRQSAFSPSTRGAEAQIRALAGRSLRHDIRAAELRSPIRLLAHGHGAKRPAARPPAGPRKHVTMQDLQFDQARERRLHLSAFRDATRRERSVKSALFADGSQEYADTCLCLFSGIVSLYQQRVYDGGDSDAVLRELYAAQAKSGKLLDLFLNSWRAAWDAGKLKQAGFAWAESVDWLVCRFESLRAARMALAPQTSPPRRRHEAGDRIPARPHALVAAKPDDSVLARAHAQSKASIALRRGASGDRGTLLSGMPRGKSGFMPGRQAETLPVSGTPRASGHLAPRQASGQAHPAQVDSGRENSPLAQIRRKVDGVRAVLTPSSPLSPVSPSSPTFPKLIPVRRGESAGPGAPMDKRRASDRSRDVGALQSQRSASSPYRAKSLATIAAITPGQSANRKPSFQ
jgi:hypothetical protein